MSPNEAVDLLFRTHRTSLVAHLSRQWPGFCLSRVEDAISEAFSVLLAQPELLQRSLDEGGTQRAVGLVRTIAWRVLRAQHRQHRGRTMVSAELLGSAGPRHDPGQIEVTHLKKVWPGALERAAREVSPRHADELVVALIDKFESGDPDTRVAERHGVRREYLCKAKNLVTAELKAAG